MVKLGLNYEAIMKIVETEFPLSVTQLIQRMGYNPEIPTVMNQFLYALRKMGSYGMIRMKKVGANQVITPIAVEQIRKGVKFDKE